MQKMNNFNIHKLLQGYEASNTFKSVFFILAIHDPKIKKVIVSFKKVYLLKKTKRTNQIKIKT